MCKKKRAGKENKNVGQRDERSRHKWRKRDCVWPRKIPNVEAGNDAIEVGCLF